MSLGCYPVKRTVISVEEFFPSLHKISWLRPQTHLILKWCCIEKLIFESLGLPPTEMCRLCFSQVMLFPHNVAMAQAITRGEGNWFWKPILRNEWKKIRIWKVGRTVHHESWWVLKCWCLGPRGSGFIGMVWLWSFGTGILQSQNLRTTRLENNVFFPELWCQHKF